MINVEYILTSDKTVFDVDVENKIMSARYEDGRYFVSISEDYIYVHNKVTDIEEEDTMTPEEITIYNIVLEEKIQEKCEDIKDKLDWEETMESLSASSLNRI